MDLPARSCGWWRRAPSWLGGLWLAAAAGPACQRGFEDGSGLPPADDDAADDDTTPSDDDGGLPSYDHFCGDPLVGGAASGAWAALFESSVETVDDTRAPRLIHPQEETWYPANWPQPVWDWTQGGGGANVFWLEVHYPEEECPLRVITTDLSWTVEAQAWSDIRLWDAGVEGRVHLEGAVVDTGSGALLQGPWSTGDRRMATLPFSAPGKIVYWTTSSESLLKALIGDAAPSYFYGPSNNGGYCVGCHDGSPDGQYIAATRYVDGYGGFTLELFDNVTYGGMPGLSDPALSQMHTAGTTWPAFSEAWWTDTERRIVAVYNGTLVSIGLTNGVVSTLATDGDGRLHGEPAWSPDGSTVVYASSDGIYDGRTGDEPVDLYSVPYSNGFGGAATPLPGASDGAWLEYYPSYSPDGRWLAYNRSFSGSYATPYAELMVIPAAGGVGTLVAANTPPPETGESSPGMYNSWPRWAPVWQDVDGTRWYFITFSSYRTYGISQVWIAPLSQDPAGALHSYPALHLPGQDTATFNHTPVWLRD